MSLCEQSLPCSDLMRSIGLKRAIIVKVKVPENLEVPDRYAVPGNERRVVKSARGQREVC